MNVIKDLTFDAIFDVAIKEWPKAIEVKEQVVYPNGNIHYPELWIYPDSIIKKYLGTSDEVIMRQLHDAIGFAVGDAAAFVTCIHPAELRRSVVRRDFETALRERITPDCGWGPRDFELIDEYFFANKPADQNQFTFNLL